MASVASQLTEEVTAHSQTNSLEDAREICTNGIYFPNNLRIYTCVCVCVCIYIYIYKHYISLEQLRYFFKLRDANQNLDAVKFEGLLYHVQEFEGYIRALSDQYGLSGTHVTHIPGVCGSWFCQER